MKRIALIMAFSVCAALFTPRLFAQTDAATQEALQKTMQLLTDPSQRVQAINENAEAKQAAKNAEALAGSPENAQKMYEIAAQIFAQLVEQSKGDPVKLTELVQGAQKDPALFLQTLSPQNRAAIEKLAAKIATDKSRKRAPPSR